MGRDRDRFLRQARSGSGRTPGEGHARRRREMRPLLEGADRGRDEPDASDPVPEVHGRGGVGVGVQAGGMMRGRHVGLGLVAGLIVLAADQASKWWVLNVLDLPEKRQIVLLPVLNLTMVWNRGVTFG